MRSVDASAGSVTLTHGEIPSLGMSPMTMVFDARKSLLRKIKAGDRVRFIAVKRGDAYVITRIEPALKK